MKSEFFKIFRDYKEVSLRYDPRYRAIWCYYNPAKRPCFSPTMLKELRQFQQSIMDYFATEKNQSDPLIRYQILHSQVSGIFNLGGDLALFSQLIREKNQDELFDYARQCIDICYLNNVNLHVPITTISLVEGMALGGGFESALSSNILIATENAEMGFPEIRFNLFPGMGAFSLLARTCGIRTAEKMIASGETYNAKKLYEMGIVDYLGEKGKGVETAEKFMRQHMLLGNGRRALQQARQRYHALDYQELLDITKLWVDAALRLEEKDLKLIDRLVKAQSAKMSQKKMMHLRTRQDRRFIQGAENFPLADWSGKTIQYDRRKNPDRRCLIKFNSLAGAGLNPANAWQSSEQILIRKSRKTALTACTRDRQPHP
jgi:DSF synthase